MKTKFVSLSMALFAAALAYAAERVPISQLPEAVKGALSASGDLAAAKEANIRNLAGKTVYEVEVERDNAPNARLLIAVDGAIMSDSRQAPADALSAASAIYSEFGAPVLRARTTLEKLPPKAQDAIKKEAAGREIAVINPTTLDGRTAYRVEFKERGRNFRLYVAEDGTLLRPEEKPPATPIGTKFEDTPGAVQKTIRNEVRDGEVLNIHRYGLVAEATTYTVDIRNRSEIFQLVIKDNGSIARDSRKESVPPSRPD